MKKLLAVFGVLVFATSIVAFAGISVNAPTALPTGSGSLIQADSSPLPPPIPPLAIVRDRVVECADSSPLPPPIPRMFDPGQA